MATSHLKYDQPDDGDGIATETFTEDTITKHFQRTVPGYKPHGDWQEIWADTVGPKPDILSLCTSGQDNWTATGGGDGSYYYNHGDNLDFDRLVVIEMLYASGANALAEGTLGSLGNNEYAIGDNDSLGFDTIYIKRNDPDAQVTGYYSLHYCWSCDGHSKVLVSSVFDTAGESIVVHPILFIGATWNPLILDAVTLTETEETWSDVDDMINGLPGNGFVFDTYGAMAYGFLVTTAPATGTAFLRAQAI
jgi:hypothetical protein